MKEDNKNNNQKKSYSSKNSKYLQQAQKLFDKNNSSENSTPKKNSGQVNNNQQAKTNNTVKKSNSRTQNYQAKKKNNQNVNKQNKNNSQKNQIKKNNDLSNNTKKVEAQTKKVEVQTKKVINKVVIDEIESSLPKLDHAKVQEEAKKKTLELVEELKQQKNIKKKTEIEKEPAKDTKKESVKDTKKVTDKSKVLINKEVNKNVTKDDNVYDFKELKNEVNHTKIEKSVESNKKVDIKKDELLEKLQEELNKKDLEIINDLNISDDEELEADLEEEKDTKEELKPIDEPPIIKKVDEELKELIKKEEETEKKEEKVAKIENLQTKNEEKIKKGNEKRKKVTKFGKVLNILAFIGFVFFVLSIVVFVYKVEKTNLIPMKYIHIGSGILGGFSLIMLLFNITRSKILHILEILFTGLLGGILIFGSIYLTKINEGLKAVFSAEEEKALYYVLVPSSSKYNNIDDLKDLKVGILNTNVDQIKEVLKDYNLQYEISYSIGALSATLISNNDDEKVDAIIVNQAIYDNFEEIDKNFFNLIKKIHEFEVIHESEDVVKEDPNAEIIPGETEEPVSPEKPKRNPELLKDVNVGNSFIVYINGVDGRGSGVYGLSDVNMLAVVNPNTHKVLLVSVPRDYFIRIPGTTPGMRDKLSHSGLYGINTSVAAMEGIFGIDIIDYAQFSFGAVPIVVNSVGGIEVYSDTEFDSFHMKGWHVPKGWIYLDGAKALAYARERYAYIGLGDKHRVKNQQDVVQAIIKKVETDPQQLLKFDQVLADINPYFKTNISYDRMQALLRQQLNSLSPWSIEKISVDGYGGMEVTASYPKNKAYVMYPYENTIITAQERILAVMTGN